MTDETKPKKKINSKKKGNAGENQIAKLLSTTFAPFVFKRVLTSGALLGGKNAVNLDHYTDAGKCAFVGDVFCSNDTENKFRFCIESKSYGESETMEKLFGSSKIFEWLNEVDIDKVKIAKEGIVIFKFNRTPLYAAVRKHIELPAGINFITLPDESKVCHLEDLLKFRDFWFVS